MAPKSKYMTGYKVTTDHRTIKRNERERNRVQNLNSSFEVLRQNIPGAAPMKKMSKIQILHQAVGYIQYLHQLIDSTGHSVKTEMTSPVMTGPVGQQYEAYPAYYQQYPAPLTPVSPGSYQSDTSGVFSDYSLLSPNTQDWQHHHIYQYQQTFPEVTSTTSASSDQVSEDEEEDVIDAIADWQQHL